MIKSLLYLFVGMLSINVLHAQIIQYASPIDTAKKNAADTVKKPVVVPSTLTFSLDMRTRFEARHGYKSVPTADTNAAFLINQRTRFNVDYKSKNLDVFLSLQDARVYGDQQDPEKGNLRHRVQQCPYCQQFTPFILFEGYVEPKFGDSKFSAAHRPAREVIYDNQRFVCRGK